MTLTEKNALPWVEGESGEEDFSLLVNQKEMGRVTPALSVRMRTRHVKAAVHGANLLGQAEREGWVDLIRDAAVMVSIADNMENADRIHKIADAIDAAIKGAG